MVIAAAKKAHIHEFISQIPEGDDTQVEDHCEKLSGGLRQRIAIVRAILKDSPILIMDEAISLLDSQSEGFYTRITLRANEEKTSILIAHRLSTLLSMDRILVFAGVMIAEDGIHTQLLRQKGRSRDLWDRQVLGFLPNDD